MKEATSCSCLGELYFFIHAHLFSFCAREVERPCVRLSFGAVRKDFVLIVYAAIFDILECMVNGE